MRSLLPRSIVRTTTHAALTALAALFLLLPMGTSGFVGNVHQSSSVSKKHDVQWNKSPPTSSSLLNSYLSSLIQPTPPEDGSSNAEDSLTKDFRPTRGFTANGSGSYLSNLVDGPTTSSAATASSYSRNGQEEPQTSFAAQHSGHYLETLKPEQASVSPWDISRRNSQSTPSPKNRPAPWSPKRGSSPSPPSWVSPFTPAAMSPSWMSATVPAPATPPSWMSPPAVPEPPPSWMSATQAIPAAAPPAVPTWSASSTTSPSPWTSSKGMSRPAPWSPKRDTTQPSQPMGMSSSQPMGMSSPVTPAPTWMSTPPEPPAPAPQPASWMSTSPPVTPAVPSTVSSPWTSSKGMSRPAPWSPKRDTTQPSRPMGTSPPAPVSSWMPTPPAPEPTPPQSWMSPPAPAPPAVPPTSALPSPWTSSKGMSRPVPWSPKRDTAQPSLPMGMSSSPPPATPPVTTTAAWSTAWNTKDSIRPTSTNDAPTIFSRNTDVTTPSMDPTVSDSTNASPTAGATRKAPWSPRKGANATSVPPAPAWTGSTWNPSLGAMTPVVPPPPTPAGNTWNSPSMNAPVAPPPPAYTPPAPPPPAYTPPVAPSSPSPPMYSSFSTKSVASSSRPAPWSPQKNDGRPAPWTPDKDSDRPVPWSPRKDGAGSTPPASTPWNSNPMYQSNVEPSGSIDDGPSDEDGSEVASPPQYMIWQGMLDSTRTNDTNLIGDITETEGVVIRAPGANAETPQAYSYLDTMEDDDYEKSEAELLAEKIQAAAVDVEITDKTIAEKEAHETEYDDDPYPANDLMGSPLTPNSFLDDKPKDQKNLNTGRGLDQIPPPPTQQAPRRRESFVRWDNMPRKGVVPPNDPSRDTTKSIPFKRYPRTESEIRAVRYPPRKESPVEPPQPPPQVNESPKQALVPPPPQREPEQPPRRELERPPQQRVEQAPRVGLNDTTTNYVDEEYTARDKFYMKLAVELASSDGALSSLPNPNVGAVLVAEDDTVLGQSHSDYQTNVMRPLLESAGLQILPGAEWIVSWPSSPELRHQLASSTLYLSFEPTSVQSMSLIAQAGIARVVIGTLDPVPEYRGNGAAALQESGILVSFVEGMQEESEAAIQDYAAIANSKFQRMARKHFDLFGRPLGCLHSSVIDSELVKAFIEESRGNLPKDPAAPIRTNSLFELAPPPDAIWVGQSNADDGEEGEQRLAMPWYEQADAVVVTFPRPGNGPPDDDSVAGRLFGVRWLATHGSELPPSVERILVLDATDLKDLPLTNDDPNLLSPDVDIEAFWEGRGRKPTRIILRRGDDRMAQELAKAAASAAEKAAEAAKLAAAAIRPGDAARAAEIAIECQKSAQASADFVLKELSASTEMRDKLESLGVIVETLDGGYPIDIMKYLGEQYGLNSVVWRAGCWGDRGLQIMRSGAFQMVSAHLTVNSEGSKFWQLMKAENAVQTACGPRSKVQVFSDQEDLSMEYCDEGDEGCVLMLNGEPVRQVRLDCRVALLEDERSRNFMLAKTHQTIDPNLIPSEDASWHL